MSLIGKSVHIHWGWGHRVKPEVASSHRQPPCLFLQVIRKAALQSLKESPSL